MLEFAGYGVLWDMDGVLVDTGEFHYQAWQAALAEAGIPFDRARFRAMFGMNNADMLAALLGHPPENGFVESVSAGKEKAFRQSIHGKAQALPGAKAWLHRFQEAGAAQAIASSAPCENIDFLVDELGLRSHFEAIISGTDMPGKPDPAVFLTAGQALNLPPERCLVIEDSVAGVQAAKRAGMACMAVQTTNPAELLSQADLIVQDLTHLEARHVLALFKNWRQV
jgi:HAD superfamily hydrolase (TIGR01509 family)